MLLRADDSPDLIELQDTTTFHLVRGGTAMSLIGHLTTGVPSSHGLLERDQDVSAASWLPRKTPKSLVSGGEALDSVRRWRKEP